jgi:1-phosphatidylinositol phosphodiesterase
MVAFVSIGRAQTTAWWRFERGSAGEPVRHPSADGVFYGAVQDSSGGGNTLSVWNEGGAGYTYTTNLGVSKANGLINNFSVRNRGSMPSMWSRTGDPISVMAPAAFTVEATFKLENGGYRTIVGRDSYGTASTNSALSALYFQAIPENRVAIKFSDISGFWHQAVSSANAIITFNPASDLDGDSVPWYSMAAVSNGSHLRLYLRNVTAGAAWQLAAETDMRQSGSPNTALSAGMGSGNDWTAGNWSVGRGLYNGAHEDRAPGFIDEVRISDFARNVSDLLYVQLPEGKSWMGWLSGGLSLSALSIPGTHDSGARFEPIAGTAKCQNLTISEQLNVGVRFLDIRCRHIDNTFTIHHGAVYQNINFTDVLNMVIGFLNSNPTECVLMSVKEEHDPSNNTRSFEATFDSYVAANPGKWILQESVPTLNQARGKIVLLRRFGASSLPKGIRAVNWADNTTFWINNATSKLRVQDYYNVSSGSAKWNSVQPILEEAAGGDLSVLYLNFTSGYKAGLFGIPNITTISNYVNPQIVSYFSNHRKGRYGVIPMDFADAQKASLIFRSNFVPGTYCTNADINRDGRINLADLIVLCSAWLRPVPVELDLWLDGGVDVKDLGVMSECWD